MNKNNPFRIAVIDSVPKIYWKDDEGFTDAGKFVDLLKPQNPDGHFDIFYAAEDQMPDHVDDYDGYMFTGSPASVHDEFDWIKRVSNLVVEANVKNKPIVASCFGHQLVAKTFGGSVAKNEQGWVIGNYELQINKQYDWMQPSASNTGLFHFNKERVTRLPEGAVSFASCELYPDFAFTLGDNILCVQGHPEQPLRSMNNFLSATKAELPDDEYRKAVEMIGRGKPDADIWARWMMQFFLK